MSRILFLRCLWTDSAGGVKTLYIKKPRRMFNYYLILTGYLLFGQKYWMHFAYELHLDPTARSDDLSCYIIYFKLSLSNSWPLMIFKFSITFLSCFLNGLLTILCFTNYYLFFVAKLLFYYYFLDLTRNVDQILFDHANNI